MLEGGKIEKYVWPLVINIIFILKVFEPFGHKLWLVTICHHDMLYNYGLSYNDMRLYHYYICEFGAFMILLITVDHPLFR
jgi:hypothetical protein